jgi:16S rRNA (adenine1518-N6/adenine1519-N6)-dimethyltransferase
MRRRPGDAAEPLSPQLRALVAGGFAHRRKTLVRSLTLSAGAAPYSREQLQAALERIGKPADVRAERLSPDDFLALERALER